MLNSNSNPDSWMLFECLQVKWSKRRRVKSVPLSTSDSSATTAITFTYSNATSIRVLPWRTCLDSEKCMATNSRKWSTANGLLYWERHRANSKRFLILWERHTLRLLPAFHGTRIAHETIHASYDVAATGA